MTDLDVFRDEYLPNAQGATVSFAGWKKNYPAEYTAWVSYRDQVLAGNLPQPPTMVSKYGKALAAAGQMAERDDMKVTVSTSGGTVDLEGTVTVTASPSPASSVTSVLFYVNSVLKSTDTSSPYTYAWDTSLVTPGAYELKAEALYPRNKKATGKLNVTVLDPVPEPPPPLPPPPEQAPVNTTAPTISGTATEGQTLTVSNGSWTNSPTSYSRQWIRCDAAGANCVPIPSATGMSYVLTATDVGATVRCAVTAYNGAGPSADVQTAQTAVVGALTPAVPVLVTSPAISGNATQGNTLAVSNGAWTNAPTSYTYQWKRCNSSGASCVSISGATATSYLLVSADVGSTIRSEVTAVNASGSSTAAPSAATAAVVVVPPPPPPTPTLGALLPARMPESTGTVFYVRTDGSDSNNGLADTAGGAWLTIQKAVNTLTAGQKARVKAGNYSGGEISVTRNLAGPQPATIEAFDPANKPVLLGSMRLQSSGGDAAAYWRFRNLKLDGTNSGITYGVKTDSGSTAVPHHIELYGLEIYDVYSGLLQPQGISISGGTGTSVTHDIHIYNCLIHDIGGPASSQNQTHSCYATTGNRIVFANNICRDQSGYNIHLNGGSTSRQGVRNSFFVNNTIVSRGITGSVVLYADSSGCPPSMLHAGNVIYNNIVTDVAGSAYQSRFLSQVNGPASPLNLWNKNLAHVYGSLSYNGDGTDTSSTFVSQPISADPKFANKAGNDFHLLAGSPAINVGLADYTPTFDYSGNARVTADLGAYRA